MPSSPYHQLNRRSFLQVGSIATAPWLVGPGWIATMTSATGQDNQQPRLIVRQEDPPNLEFPFTTLNSFITPNDLFYVRNHFSPPTIRMQDWRLRIDGLVQRPLQLSMDELRRMPQRSITCTMECAGNTRALLDPPASGVPWQLGAVSTAEWTGVPLAAVLERAGLRDQAVEVICEGADRGRVTGNPAPAEPIHFVRSLPLAVARQPEILLAYQMNGQDLPPLHGFPLRMVVPNWYGMASVKWLTRLMISDRPFTGYFQSVAYTTFMSRDDTLVVTPITQLQVKSLIAQPTAGARINRGQRYRITGAAWTGDGEIRRVEVSTDGGQTWRDAQLQGRATPHCWRLWEYNWQAPAQAGPVMILSRATDSRNRTQPAQHDPNRGGYVINHTIGVRVEVV